MKKFVFQTVTFCLLVSLAFLLLLSNADGKTDAFYKRFTSPKQESLILGTSRAAQGVRPDVFKKHLDKDIYNYSFTVSNSPYGPAYFNSVKKKLNENSTNGVFILTVDPWSICSDTKDPNDSTNFRENNSFVGKTTFVNMNPNFEYLLENLAGQYHTVLNKMDGPMLLHDDGWLEVTIKMDSASVSKRLKSKLDTYRNDNLPKYKFSSVRLQYLKQTIQLLKPHGNVYLVRLPIHPEIYKIEQELMPQFDSIISDISPATNGYLNLTTRNSEFQYTDGNHVWKESAAEVSQIIAKWIKD